MRAVDTNVLARLAARDDPRRAAVAEASVAHGAWVPALVLARKAGHLPLGTFDRALAKLEGTEPR